jgi:hypothetical protein
MMEKCDLNHCGNAATRSIEDDEGSFSLCDTHFGGVTRAALHQGLSLADAVDAVAWAENIEDAPRFRSGQLLGDGHRQKSPIPQHHRLEYRLDCGRTVHVEEIRISLSTLGHFAGSADAIRSDIITRLPDRVIDQFPGHGGFLIKPVPEGQLPHYLIMVALTCNQSVSDPAADFSLLVVGWLSDGIETSLPGLIEREIRSVEWDKHAVDGSF